MKNKKIIFLLGCLIAFAFTIKAQQNSTSAFYIKVYGGYGLLTPGSYKPSPSVISTTSNNSAFTVSSTGLGAGVHYGGGIGYIINEFLNLGVDADYLSGKKLTSTSSYSNASAGYTYSSIYSQTTTHSVLCVIPNITFKALSKPNYYIYNRLGIMLAINTKLEILDNDSANSVSAGTTDVYTSTSDQKFKFGINVGVQAALGIQFNITENIRGFFEIVGNYLPVKPTSSTAIFKSMDINNGTPNNVTSNSNYTYVKSGSYNYTSASNATNGFDVSENLPAISQSINYIGLNLGVAIKFQ